MYASFNPQTKGELKEMVKKQVVACFQLSLSSHSPTGAPIPNGDHICEGPHYPQPHKWSVRVRVKNGYIIKVLS